MALTKITAAIIEDGAITASALSNNSIGITQLNVSDGTSGQFLKTDGSGNLSFASVPAGYTDSDVESYLSGGTGVTFSSGVISIGQDVGTSSTPTFGNITTTGYIAGPATFTIDPAAVGDNTGTVVIAGNLQVDGTTTTINSTTMEVDDLNITLASGAANAAAANGAGITVDGASATITYDGTNDEWDFNKSVTISGSPQLLLNLYRTTSTPGIKFTNGGATGYGYLVGDNDEFTFGYNDGSTNTAQLKIDSSGNVGIGTASPNNYANLSTLTIDGTNGSVLDFESGGTLTGEIFSSSASLAISFKDDSDCVFYGNITERMRITNAGNVGIGTSTNISSPLTVQTDGSANSISIIGRNNGTSDEAVISFYEYDGTTRNAYIIKEAGNLAVATGTGGSPSERMRIDSAGTIFQGTTTPTLHSAVRGIVFENGSIINDVTRGAGKSITLAQNAAIDSGNTWAYLATDEASYYQQFNGNHYFGTAPSGSAGADVTFDTKLFIGNTGNVGIGTTSPNQLLTVNLPGRNDTETNSLGAAVVAGPISGPPSHDFTNSNCIFRVQGNNATNNIQFGVGNGLYGYNPWIQASYDNSTPSGTDYNAKHLLIQPIGGSVAIGKETYASAKLEVVGSIYSNNEGGSSYSSYGTGAELRVINLSVNQSAIHYIEIGGNLPGYTAGQYNCLSTDLNDLHFAAGGVYTGYISYNGGFTDISDEREKENIVTISNATAKLKQLRGVYHTWKDTASRGTDTQIGLIAQEVEAVVPEVVTTSNPTSLNTPESDTDGLKGVAYAKLVPLLIETIKELEARITTLEG